MTDRPRPTVQFDKALEIQPAPGLRICLLGGFRILCGGNSLTAEGIPLRRARDLLKLLALAPGHRLHREQLLEMLWPEREPEAAAHSLAQALYTLRPKLADLDPSVRVQFEDECLVLSAEGGVTTDVEDFEQAARRSLSQTDRRSSQAAASVQEAIIAYAGDLLPEDGPSDLFYQRRDELRGLYLALLLRLADYNLEAQEYLPAIDALQKVIASDPANEDAQARLMRLYALSGQRQAALRQYQVLEEALRRELEVDPAPESQLLRQQILDGTLAPMPPSLEWLFTPQHNLPALISSFIGREAELAEVRGLVQSHRLVTLTGAGGVGKTRLALQVAESLRVEFPQGVVWVELATLTNPDGVAEAVLEVFRLPAESERPELDRLVDFLRNRHLLLLLDNCEHLVAASARLAERLLKACPNLRILATSQARLDLPGEVIYRVPSLAVPVPGQILSISDLARYDAVRLFTERTSNYVSGFMLTEDNAPAIALICRRLDGIPLALELAAARSRLLTVEQIAGQLEDAFNLLVGGSQAVLPRHRTLRASIDWSYALLSGKERLLLQRLSVFAGGWGWEAAQDVCAGEEIHPAEVLDLLAGLVDHSLVISATLPGDEARYHLLETVRQYALERLVESCGEAAAYRRHLEYFLHLAEQADLGIRGPRQQDWLDRLAMEHGNLTAALDRALGSPLDVEPGVRLVCALDWYWRLVGDYHQRQHYLTRALSQSADFGRTPVRALILLQAAFACISGTEFLTPQEKLAYAEQSLGIWREQDRVTLLEQTQCRLVIGLVKKVDFLDDGGLETLYECKQTYHRLGNLWWEAWTDNLIGIVLLRAGPLDDISAILQDETELWRKTGDRRCEAIPLLDSGDLALRQGDYNTAQGYYLRSLELSKELGSKGFAVYALIGLGDTALAQQEFDQAEMYYENCAGLELEIRGRPLSVSSINWSRGLLALHKGDIQQAEKYLGDAIQLARQSTSFSAVPLGIAGIAALCAARGKYPEAVRLFAAARRKIEADKLYLGEIAPLEIDHFLGLCQAQCDPKVFEQSWAEGCAMSLEQAESTALALAN